MGVLDTPSLLVWFPGHQPCLVPFPGVGRGGQWWSWRRQGRNSPCAAAAASALVAGAAPLVALYASCIGGGIIDIASTESTLILALIVLGIGRGEYW